jgi:hypothetical protein
MGASAGIGSCRMLLWSGLVVSARRAPADDRYPRLNRAPQVTQRMMSLGDMAPAIAPTAAPTAPPARKPPTASVPVTSGAPNEVPWHLAQAPPTATSLKRGHDGWLVPRS